VGVGEEAVEGDGIFVGAIALGDGAGGGTAADGAAAMTAISTAIDSLATAFSSVGATQSRLDSALNQAQIALENTAAAESVIRDVDFASEFTSLTKSQILSQTGISVLAQSNSRAQSVLALLQ
jgi:flagellin